MPRPCPCGRKRTRDTCCGPLVEGVLRPDAAVDLMRSRYTAYCEGAVEYLLETTAADRRASLSPEALRTYCAGLRGVSLEILETEAGGPDDLTGTVTFRARLRSRGRPFEQVEKSLFEREEGRWVYVDALS